MVCYAFLLVLCLLGSSRTLEAAKPRMISTIPEFEDNSFSGVYLPNKVATASDFSASWLVAVQYRFLMAEREVNHSSNMAGVTFAMVRKQCSNCASVMTRDYLDLFVEHLSSTTNQIPKNDAAVFAEEAQRLRSTSKWLQTPMHMKQNEDSRQNETLAILVFSSKALSVTVDSAVQEGIRIPFFEATFYSVHRYYSHVIVFVQDQKDYDIVRAMGLPAWKIVIMNVPLDIKGYATALPKQSILQVVDRLKNKDPEYASFQYVYFTEGDQILHMRHQKELYDLIDDSDGSFIVIPHRMNTLPLKQDFLPALQNGLTRKSLDIPDAHVVVEDLFTPRGSCCDDGRYEVASCDSWWFLCPDWGVRDMSPWLKFGNSGFTMPPATEHRGKCVYSAEKRRCVLPPSCREGHYPRRTGTAVSAKEAHVCSVSPHITYLGPDRKDKIDKQEPQTSVADAEYQLQSLFRDVAKLKKEIRQTRQKLKESASAAIN